MNPEAKPPSPDQVKTVDEFTECYCGYCGKDMLIGSVKEHFKRGCKKAKAILLGNQKKLEEKNAKD